MLVSLFVRGLLWGRHKRWLSVLCPILWRRLAHCLPEAEATISHHGRPAPVLARSVIAPYRCSLEIRMESGMKNVDVLDDYLVFLASGKQEARRSMPIAHTYVKHGACMQEQVVVDIHIRRIARKSACRRPA
ncbi:hypothetical protein [Herbaspirillum sp.]|uniref:hypothetical protein n=1 Tax=Herbaspirillum sp. TaxID=1890675 RepID=UPI001B03B0E2|nr:hypothetical protein [Herbaspirillum sp.]MBO9538068.1 hypothetical protein [Herbaspirillum sp.]